MAGGLMQLVGYGNQDIYLTGNEIPGGFSWMPTTYTSTNNHQGDSEWLQCQQIEQRELCDITLETEDECGVCYSSYKTFKQLGCCKKYICTGCTNHWFIEQQKYTCPYCRCCINTGSEPASNSEPEPTLDQSFNSQPLQIYVRRPPRHNGRFGSRIVRIMSAIVNLNN